MANYHPTPELLTAFSAGSLQLSHSLCVSVHIQHCDECRINLQRLRSIATQLFDDQQPASVSDSLRNAVFAQLDEHYSEENNRENTLENNTPSNIPKALQQFVKGDYSSLNWKKVTSAIQSAHLCTDVSGSKVEIMRIKAGGKVPTHTHIGEEYTLLLEGSFSDEEGLYNQGDFLVRDGRHKHRPVATKDRDCLCLAVTDAPIKFTGVFTRLLNPLLQRGYLFQ